MKRLILEGSRFFNVPEMSRISKYRDQFADKDPDPDVSRVRARLGCLLETIKSWPHCHYHCILLYYFYSWYQNNCTLLLFIVVTFYTYHSLMRITKTEMDYYYSDTNFSQSIFHYVFVVSMEWLCWINHVRYEINLLICYRVILSWLH